MGLYPLEGWWVALYALGAAGLGLFMVEAMLQFTSALLERPPRRRTAQPAALDELRQRLLALGGGWYRVTPRGGSALAVEWDVLAGSPVPPDLRLKLTTTWKTRMLLDPRRHEARWFESVRTSSFFVGFVGFLPRLTAGWNYQGGYLSGTWYGQASLVTRSFPPRVVDTRPFEVDTDELRTGFVSAVTDAGWAFRPVTLPFYASSWWLAFTDRLVPDALAGIPRRTLWGALYPASYLALLASLLAPLTGIGTGDIGVLLLVSAAWWAIWGLVAWLLVRAPHRRKREGSADLHVPRRRTRRRS